MTRRNNALELGTALVVSLIVSAGCQQKHPELAPMAPPVVFVALPLEREVTDFQIFTARTQAVQSVEVRARVTGYLTKIEFTDGEEVKENAVLFQIDDRPYKASLDEAKASLEIAKAMLIKAQTDYDIGLTVQKNNAGAISAQDLAQRLAGRDEAKGRVDAAKASLENAQLNFDWCKVTAPIAGRANRHFVDVGNIVDQNTTVLTNIVSIRPIWAYFDVDEVSVRKYEKLVLEGKIKSARTTQIPVAMALVGDSNFTTPGYIDFISNQLDPNTGSIRLRAVFPNENGLISAGMFGRIRVPNSAPHDALLVADSAIGSNQGQQYIYVLSAKNEVEYRPVETGQLRDGLREVLRYREVPEPGGTSTTNLRRVESLAPTDRVVVQGLQRIRPGVTVNPRVVSMDTLQVSSDSSAPAIANPPSTNAAHDQTTSPTKADSKKAEPASSSSLQGGSALKESDPKKQESKQPTKSNESSKTKG